MQHVVPKIVTLMGIFDRIKEHTNVKLLISELRKKDIKEPSRKISEYEQSFFEKIEKMVADLDIFYEDFLFFSHTMLDEYYKKEGGKLGKDYVEQLQNAGYDPFSVSRPGSFAK